MLESWGKTGWPGGDGNTGKETNKDVKLYYDLTRPGESLNGLIFHVRCWGLERFRTWLEVPC